MSSAQMVAPSRRPQSTGTTMCCTRFRAEDGLIGASRWGWRTRSRATPARWPRRSPWKFDVILVDAARPPYPACPDTEGFLAGEAATSGNVRHLPTMCTDSRSRRKPLRTSCAISGEAHFAVELEALFRPGGGARIERHHPCRQGLRGGSS